MFSAGSITFNRARYCGALVVLLVAGCSSGGNDSAADAGVASAPDTSTADTELAARLYAGTPRTPAAFLAEESQYPDRSEFKFHVSNGDVSALSAGELRFELCSDDFAEALQWSATAADARALPSQLTATAQTQWYFQFDRTLASVEPAMVVNRVFRCAALDRSTRDALGNAGTVNLAPFTADDLQYVSEYLWQFSLYNNALHVVIDSFPDRQSVDLQHILERAQLFPGEGEDPSCDRVEIWHWTHRIASGGALSEADIFVRGFDVRRDNGVVSLCPT